jgi:hypothetical protein
MATFLPAFSSGLGYIERRNGAIPTSTVDIISSYFPIIYGSSESCPHDCGVVSDNEATPEIWDAYRQDASFGSLCPRCILQSYGTALDFIMEASRHAANEISARICGTCGEVPL